MREYFVIEDCQVVSVLAPSPQQLSASTVFYLNSIGRWAASGSVVTPLLIWSDSQSAEAACFAARTLRGNPGLRVGISAISRHQIGQQAAFYSSAEHASALAGDTSSVQPSSARIYLDFMKTALFSHALLDLNTAPDKVITEDVWTKKIQQILGGGSLVSASQYLSGRRAAAVLNGFRDGQIALPDGLALDDIEQAVHIARQQPWNCGASAGQGLTAREWIL